MFNIGEKLTHIFCNIEYIHILTYMFIKCLLICITGATIQTRLLGRQPIRRRVLLTRV